MEKIFRIIIVLAVQAGLLFVLGYLWLLFGTEWAAQLADPAALSGPFAEQNLKELKEDLRTPAAITGVVAMFCTLLWLAWSSYRKILTPTDINTMYWWILLMAGAVLAGGGAFWALYHIAPLTEEARFGLALFGVLIFVAVYIGGSLFTHPKMRAAVPLPYRVKPNPR
ncbi:MAG: hypothetical protein EKK69_02515 [Candidatus Competibacteraceae bacterium]|nr:MAG: hypothetical protein EKK69_02515 [Candidatus Competibacteraceae bacterium]